MSLCSDLSRQLMAFITLKTIVLKKLLLTFFNFSFLLFSVYLLPSVVKYKSNMTLLSREGACYRIMKMHVTF